MSEQQFHNRVDALFLAIEQWLEKEDVGLDFETQENILTITLPTEAQCIFSRQVILQEVWLATPLGAYHFQFTSLWETKQGQSLITVLQTTVEQLTGIVLNPKTFNLQEMS